MDPNLQYHEVMATGDSTPASAQVILVDTTDDAATEVRKYFQTEGFETGPLVGISFSITASAAHFNRTLKSGSSMSGFGGTAARSREEVQLDTSVLPDDIKRRVSAIVLPGPPDFGAGGSY